ncbi:MAG: prepilin-type N-terminal cleavage/methylation domain-containing protein [Thermodesulfovibrionia bacterium]|nr:prepilin-type N-terminal cleavage/methylation domain-containing protein [Thermodesulfovibrionia bacterium]
MSDKFNKGFTLLEVMIALAIIGATLTVSLYTVNYHAQVSSDNALKTQMLLQAKEKLGILELDRQESNGVIEGTGFTYESTIGSSGFEEIVELKTVIKGNDKEFLLRKLAVKKDGH